MHRLQTLARRLAPETPDGDLLAQYAQSRCDDAFAQLVVKYGRLVWGQCRAQLPNDADAEDAFQATFLALSQAAKKLPAGTPLGPWLHGVAYRVCLNARRQFARRVKRDRRSAEAEATRPVADTAWDAAFAAAAEEVQKLPPGQRAAFVVCCIECRPAHDAAEVLRISPGTLATRLSRAKQTLLDRLAARGLGAGAVALGGLTGAAAAAPAAVVRTTLTLVSGGSAIPGSVHILMHGVTGMAVMRFKLLAAAVIVAAGLGLGGGGWSNPAIAQPPSGTPTPKEIELQRRLDALEAATREAEFRAVRDRALQAVAADAAPAAKYEYEPVPKAGFTPKQLEGRIAERERAGWTLVGQISMTAPYINTKSDGTPLDLPTPSLVFRKVSEAAVKTNPAAEKYRLFDDTQAPKQQAEAAAKLAHSLYMKAVDEKRYAEDKAKAAATVADGNLGELFGPNHPRMKAEASRDGDQLRIAELEREVMRLQVLLKTGGAKLPAAPPPASADTKVPARPMIASDPNAGTGKETASVRMNIKKAEYGTWDPDELIRVIGKVMKEDFQTKQLVGPLHAVAIESGITVVGTPGAVDAFAKWVAVLKK